MRDAEISAIILELIGEIAPEADHASTRDRDDLREVFDLIRWTLPISSLPFMIDWGLILP
jgi:hypothetical protein